MCMGDAFLGRAQHGLSDSPFAYQRLRLYGPTMSDAVAREVLALNPLAEQRLIDATGSFGTA